MSETPQNPPKSPENPPKSPQNPSECPEKPQNEAISAQNRRRERTRLRNRRFAALRELIRGSDYFSEHQMRLRAPGLFHQLIGRFQDPKNPQKPPKPPQNQPQICPKICPKISPKSAQNQPQNQQNSTQNLPQNLRELLLNVLEESPGQADEDEEEEEEDEEDEDEEDENRVPEAAELELLREEFTSQMFQRFLEGQDGDFDYSQVDENPDLDNLDIVTRDLEEKYFDEEEPSQAPALE